MAVSISRVIVPGTTREVILQTDGKRLVVGYPASNNEVNRIRQSYPDLKPETIGSRINEVETIIYMGEYVQSDTGNRVLLGAYDPKVSNDPASIDGRAPNSQVFATLNPSTATGRNILSDLQYQPTIKDNIPPFITQSLNSSVATSSPQPAPAGSPPAPSWTNPQPAPLPSTGGVPVPAAAGGSTAPAAPVTQPAPAPAPGSVPVPTQPVQTATVKKTTLSYPAEMKPEQDKIRFRAMELNKRQSKAGSSASGLQFSFGDRNFIKAENQPDIFIAVQSSISDQNAADWGPDSINGIDSALYYKSLQIAKPGGNMAGELGNFSQQILEELKAQGGYMSRYLAGQAAANNNILARTDGIVLNPNLELLFQGPQLRPFTFQIKMSARDQGEANDIKSIIKFFKKNMAVKRGTAGALFLSSPNVFEISYLHWDTATKKYVNHPGLNIIHKYSDDSVVSRACALTNCSVDYTPLGSYTTYEDGTMAAYSISLQFQDINPVYQEDYEEGFTIGY